MPRKDRRAAEDKVRGHAKLTVMHLPKAAEVLEAKAQQTLTYFAFLSDHWRQIETNNPLERIIRELSRRTRVVGAFPDGHSALMLCPGTTATHREYEMGQAALPSAGNIAQSASRGGNRLNWIRLPPN
jgi:transposase-like protein